MSTEWQTLLGVSDSKGETNSEASTRYPALLLVARIYRILAIVTGIAALIVVTIGMQVIDRGGIFLVLGGVLGGLIGVVTNLAIAECIKVFLDIEANTRNGYYCLWNYLNKK